MEIIMAKHIMILFILIFSLVLINPTSGENIYFSIDKHAKTAPKKHTKSIDSLAKYLIRPANNDKEKARALYIWIVHNIKYDWSALKGYMYKNRALSKNVFHAKSVLKRRKGVCAGYSHLFKALAESAGLEVVVIGGWVKNIEAFFGRNTTDKAFANRINHAWNAVKVDGAWNFIESTWGTAWGNSNNPNNGIYVYNPPIIDHFFMTPPDKMLHTHYPKDKKWLLINDPISKKEFDTAPYLFPGYFIHNIKMVSPKKFDTQCGRKSSIVLTNLPVNKHTMALKFYKSVMTRGMKMNKYEIVHFQYDKENKNSKANLTFSRPGEYIVLVIVVHQVKGKNQSDHSLLYRFNSRF